MTDLQRFDGCFVAIGNNRIRLAKQRMLAEKGATFPVLIHPSAVVSRYAKLESGCVVMAGASAAVVSDIADNLTVVGVPARTHGMTTTPSLRTE